MYYNSQNLKKVDNTNDAVNWRFWLGDKTQLSGQLVIPTKSCAATVSFCKDGGQEEAVSLHLAVPLLFNLFLGFENRFLYKLIEKITKRKKDRFTNGREIGFSIHNNTLWVSLWKDPMEYRSVDPKWWSFTVDFEKIFLGKVIYSSEVIEEREVEIPMPDKSYKAAAKLERATWKHARWFSKSILRVSFEIEGGIPIPGKGTASYNCGDDAIYSMTTPSKSIASGVGSLVGSCLNDRIRYGGWGSYKWDRKK